MVFKKVMKLNELNGVGPNLITVLIRQGLWAQTCPGGGVESRVSITNSSLCLNLAVCTHRHLGQQPSPGLPAKGSQPQVQGITMTKYLCTHCQIF